MVGGRRKNKNATGSETGPRFRSGPEGDINESTSDPAKRRILRCRVRTTNRLFARLSTRTRIAVSPDRAL